METRTIANQLCIVLFLLFINHANAQENDDGEIDVLYQKFSASFKDKDIDLFKSLYLSEAQYLIFDGKIQDGHEEFVPNIEGFFNDLTKNGDSIDIKFQIEKRFYSKDHTMATDVGYFLFERKSTGQADVSKMVNVFVKKDGKWNWLIDMSSKAPKEVFKSHQTILKR